MKREQNEWSEQWTVMTLRNILLKARNKSHKLIIAIILPFFFPLAQFRWKMNSKVHIIFLEWCEDILRSNFGQNRTHFAVQFINIHSLQAIDHLWAVKGRKQNLLIIFKVIRICAQCTVVTTIIEFIQKY